MVFSVELVRLAWTVVWCARLFRTGVLLLIASSIFQELPELIVIYVHAWRWY